MIKGEQIERVQFQAVIWNYNKTNKPRKLNRLADSHPATAWPTMCIIVQHCNIVVIMALK